MSVQFISKVLKELENEAFKSKLGPFIFDSKPPIHADSTNGKDELLRNWNSKGIYLLTEPAEQGNTDLWQNQSAVWYIGKTYSNVYNRIRSHLGSPNEGHAFGQHEWRDLKYIPEKIREFLSKCQVEIYLIEVGHNPSLSEDKQRLVPELIEKQLLLAYVHEYGELPVLNRQF